MREFGPFTFWELLALIVAASAIAGSLGVFLVHQRLEGRVRDAHNDVVIPMYATAGVIYAVLLAFIVIAVWEQYTGAKDNVSSEGSALTSLYRETAGMPHPLQRALRPLLRSYTEAVATDEWKVQSSGGTSPVARRDLVETYTALGKVPPAASSAVDQGFVAELSEMTSDRTKRILASQERLPWILWLGLIAGAGPRRGDGMVPLHGERPAARRLVGGSRRADRPAPLHDARPRPAVLRPARDQARRVRARAGGLRFGRPDGG